MTYKFEKLMQDWDVNMDSPILDKAFVAKVTDFRAKLEKKSLTDEEITVEDDELCKMFTELHELKEEEPEEVKKANYRARIAEAKEEVVLAETIDDLKKLQTKFDDLPDLQPFIAKRIEKFEKAAEENNLIKFLTESKQEIQAAAYDTLPGLLEKYKDQQELISLINQRIEKEKKTEELTLRQRLADAKKKRFTFDELKMLGIKVTGDDMEIEGIYLERQYMFKIYEITSIDGKKV